MKYSVKKGKNAKGNTWYQYTGTLKDGKTFTGKKYSSEQSARNDVNKQQYSHMAKGNISSKKTAQRRGIGNKAHRDL